MLHRIACKDGRCILGAPFWYCYPGWRITIHWTDGSDQSVWFASTEEEAKAVMEEYQRESAPNFADRKDRLRRPWKTLDGSLRADLVPQDFQPEAFVLAEPIKAHMTLVPIEAGTDLSPMISAFHAPPYLDEKPKKQRGPYKKR